jgi:N-acetyl sugar amidotransferase
MPALKSPVHRATNHQQESALEAYYGLPNEVRFCKRCVISNQRPDSTVEFKNDNRKKQTITFDDDGICAACRYADMKERQINWEERQQQLIALCREYRSRGGAYDCIVPGSGGKDSFYAAHVLKYKYGMHPLTVTWAPHLYTNVGWKNLQAWIHSGFDNILFTPNGRVHRTLTRLAFENLLHPFQPFIVGQRQIGPRVAALYGIPLIFYGENQAEYGHKLEDNFKPTMPPDFYEGDGETASVVLGGVSYADLMSRHRLTPDDLQAYVPLPREQLKSAGVTVHYLSYYLKWDPQECYYYAVEKGGFTANDERTEGSYSKYSSIDDKIDPFHYYTTLIKFGLGRASYDAAQEIRNQKITREEGVALVRRFDQEFPAKYFREFLDYIEIDESRFHERIDRARSPHLWTKEDGEWRLRHAVWMEGANV